jgi:L-threonylcarbamoyladenylate synthase
MTLRGAIGGATGGANEVAPDVVREIADVIAEGGLVCLPCGGSYRIVADLMDEDAVTRLLQAKRRTGRAPSLVFVADEAMLGAAAGEAPAVVRRLAATFWPGPLTVLLVPGPDVPPKVVKQLATREGRMGVRVPADRLVRAVVAALGRPVLVSSANREKKQGAGSPAQVRKNFVHHVDLFVDAGDLPPAGSSTVVSVSGALPEIVRPGVIAADAVAAAAAA